MLFGTEDHRARQPPLSSGRLREVDVEREPLGVEGDRARGLLHRLPSTSRNSPRPFTRAVASATSPDGTVTS